MAINQDIKNIVRRLQGKGLEKPDCSIILGSGLGELTQVLKDRLVIPYSEIPNYPKTTVSGHDGSIHFGSLNNRKVLLWSGRCHLYEGNPMDRTLLPVRISHALGSPWLIVTNAAGGINIRFEVGDIMLIDDLITTLWPFRLPPDRIPQRYAPDAIIQPLMRLAARSGIYLTRGCYLFAKGPTYETRAEVRAFQRIGADAAGMSTAPELYEAIRLGMQTLGISLITNLATGISQKKLFHSKVKEAANRSQEEFVKLLTLMITDPESPLQ